MATRRPRVKVAANLSIRRPAKAAGGAGEQIKTEPHLSPQNEKDIKPKDEETPSTTLPTSLSNVAAEEKVPKEGMLEIGPDKQENRTQEFKLPKPVDDTTKGGFSAGYESIASPASVYSSSLINTGDDPMSPRKQDVNRTGFTLPMVRKRNRTESFTSNKSLPEGVIVNKVARKVATKQEESQRTLENKKEIRKRLTNIPNVDKQNLTMFDMIYYNPVNNPMTPPALSKRGSLENLPKAVEGRGRDASRSRSVSKSRSPTPVPSGSAVATAPKPAPVQLTPQLKLGPNGEMILDEASLVIENEREKEMRETLANTDIVYQDEFSGNSGYYSRIRRTKDWADDETIRFYRCLHTIGTDFSLMLTLFPQRSRRDLKLKFKKEERLNLQLVNKALLYPKLFNLDELRKQFAEEDEIVERRKQEEEQRKREEMETVSKEQLRKKLMMRMTTSNTPQKRLSKSQRAMSDGVELPGEEFKKLNRKPSTRNRSTGGKRSKKVSLSEIEKSITGGPPAQPVPDSEVLPESKVPATESPLEDATDDGPPAEGTTGPLHEECVPEPNNPEEPFYMYDKSIGNYGAPAEQSPIVQYQCMKEKDEGSVYSDGATQGHNQDDSTTVITLQNLDDQSHTTCLRTEVAPPTVPTMINELTPVEIKYGEFGPDAGLVFLPPDVAKTEIVKDEFYTAKANPAEVNRPELIEIRLMDTLESPSGAVLTSEFLPTASSLIIPEKEAKCEHVQYSLPQPLADGETFVEPTVITQMVSCEDGNSSVPGQMAKYEITILPEECVIPPAPSYDIKVDHVEKCESDPTTPGIDPDMEQIQCKNDSREADNVEDMKEPDKEEEEDEVEEEEEESYFSLQDIDINSLVLVESQDAGDPNRTFYEIYVSHPETGQLSEKPLDVPADVIESIRLILESGER